PCCRAPPDRRGRIGAVSRRDRSGTGGCLFGRTVVDYPSSGGRPAEGTAWRVRRVAVAGVGPDVAHRRRTSDRNLQKGTGPTATSQSGPHERSGTPAGFHAAQRLVGHGEAVGRRRTTTVMAGRSDPSGAVRTPWHPRRTGRPHLGPGQRRSA